jgi:hypothetical protein
MAWRDRELPKIISALPRFESWRRPQRSLSSVANRNGPGCMP